MTTDPNISNPKKPEPEVSLARNSRIKPLKMSSIRDLVCNVAQTTHYEVEFSGFHDNLKEYLISRGVDYSFVTNKVGLLCLNASLPSASFGTAMVVGNFMGIQEKIAHTKIHSEITLDFYVDLNYNTLKFFEYWMEFIASGSNFDPKAQNGSLIKYPNIQPQSIEEFNYSVRMQYPEHYKCNQVKIYKFEKDYKNSIEYTFIGMFPLSMNPISVSYINSESLKVSLNLQYDRYYCNKNVTQALPTPSNTTTTPPGPGGNTPASTPAPTPPPATPT